ncbi:MAG TPA: tetratricopeptide repeat protein [Longimicrobium sp.]|nr:tetratricopeptide repeat protein [Longimicrobium sp.]
MDASSPPKRPRNTERRWIVPPGLLSNDEPFPGFRVLDEVRSGLGVTLWQFLRDTELWSNTPPEQRMRIFAPRAARRRRERMATLGQTRELRRPLEALSRALDARQRQSGIRVMRACQALSRWAGEQGLPHTALAFAQSAAVATPERAAAAYQVGLLSRRNAEYRRAETWFRRTLALARRGHDWRYYGLACIGLGNLHRQRGDYPTARTWFIRALRCSRRNAVWDVRPMAMHDLFCVAVTGGQHDEAEAWARRAFRAYGPRHPRLVVLAHDVARFWLNDGRYDDALKVFRAVLPHISRIPERRLVTSNMASAAAGLGDRLAFAGMWQDTWRLVDEHEDTEGVPNALVTLAQGAARLGDPDRGQLAASHALKVAIQRKENEHRLAAERVLESMRTVRVGVFTRPEPRAEADEAAEGTEPDFATQLVEVLSANLAANVVGGLAADLAD